MTPGKQVTKEGTIYTLIQWLSGDKKGTAKVKTEVPGQAEPTILEYTKDELIKLGFGSVEKKTENDSLPFPKAYSLSNGDVCDFVEMYQPKGGKANVAEDEAKKGHAVYRERTTGHEPTHSIEEINALLAQGLIKEVKEPKKFDEDLPKEDFPVSYQMTGNKEVCDFVRVVSGQTAEYKERSGRTFSIDLDQIEELMEAGTIRKI